MGESGLGRGREKERGTTEGEGTTTSGDVRLHLTGIPISPSHVNSSHRHINLSGKTGGEGQVFEHLLREVFKRLNTS